MIVFDLEVPKRIRAGAEDEVNVAVDQAWQHARIRQIDDLGIGGWVTGWLDADDASVLDIHRPVVLNRGPGPVDEPTRADHFHIRHCMPT